MGTGNSVILGRTVPIKRYEEDIHRLETCISDLNLQLVRAQSAIRKLQSAVEISECVEKCNENTYFFRGPVEVYSTPDSVTVVLLGKEEK